MERGGAAGDRSKALSVACGDSSPRGIAKALGLLPRIKNQPPFKRKAAGGVFAYFFMAMACLALAAMPSALMP